MFCEQFLSDNSSSSYDKYSKLQLSEPVECLIVMTDLPLEDADAGEEPEALAEQEHRLGHLPIRRSVRTRARTIVNLFWGLPEHIPDIVNSSGTLYKTAVNFLVLQYTALQCTTLSHTYKFRYIQLWLSNHRRYTTYKEFP